MPQVVAIEKILLIAAGGAMGSVLRYLMAGWVQGIAGSTFPAGTLAVNVAGSLAVGFLATLLTGPVLVREEYRVALLVGVLGGFTTFSTFALETLRLSGDGRWVLAMLNLLASNAAALVAVFLGDRLARLLHGV